MDATTPHLDSISGPFQTNGFDPTADGHARREWLIRTLGEPFCRKLGLYPLPEDLVLSVVIPVYNEKHTIREILRQVRAVPIPKQIIIMPKADHGAWPKPDEIAPTIAFLASPENRVTTGAIVPVPGRT